MGAGQYLRPPAAWGAGALDRRRTAAGVVGRQASGALRISVTHAFWIQAARATTDVHLQLCVYKFVKWLSVAIYGKIP